MLSDAPSAAGVHLNPSSTVVKHHGKDIIKKSQRRSSRFLGSSLPSPAARSASSRILEPKTLSSNSISPRAKGGAGAAPVANQGIPKARIQCAEPESPKTPIEDDLSDSEINSKDTKEIVPVRHSARTTRKSYKKKVTALQLLTLIMRMLHKEMNFLMKIRSLLQGQNLRMVMIAMKTGLLEIVTQHSVIRCVDDKARSCRRCGVV